MKLICVPFILAINCTHDALFVIMRNKKSFSYVNTETSMPHAPARIGFLKFGENCNAPSFAALQIIMFIDLSFTVQFSSSLWQIVVKFTEKVLQLLCFATFEAVCE